MRTMTANNSMERTGASRSVHSQFGAQWRLAPAAHARRWATEAARSIFRALPSSTDIKTTLRAAVLTLFVVSVLSGCKHPPMSSSYPPAKLAGLIADTDHIVITNRFGDREPRYRGFSLTVSGDEARQIVRAISSSQHCAPTDSVFDWDLQFYREAQLLADVQVQASHFVFEGEEYFDGRVLERLYHDLLKRTGAQF